MAATVSIIHLYLLQITWFTGISYLLNSLAITIKVKFLVISDTHKAIGVCDCLTPRKSRSLLFLSEVILIYSFNGNLFINTFLAHCYTYNISEQIHLFQCFEMTNSYSDLKKNPIFFMKKISYHFIHCSFNIK